MWTVKSIILDRMSRTSSPRPFTHSRAKSSSRSRSVQNASRSARGTAVRSATRSAVHPIPSEVPPNSRGISEGSVCRSSKFGRKRGKVCHFLSKLAREVGRLTGWREKIFGRRYQAIVISSEEAAQIERLRYILANGCVSYCTSFQDLIPGILASAVG